MVFYSLDVVDNFWPLWVAGESKVKRRLSKIKLKVNPRIIIASRYPCFMALGLAMKGDGRMTNVSTVMFSLSARVFK
jgi:hypothetical protein